MTIYSQAPPFKDPPKSFGSKPGIELPDTKVAKQKVMAHFFESPSKYIPLKGFNA